MIKTEVFDLDDRFGKEYAGHYVFKEIFWAKRNRILQKHTKYHPVSGQVVSSDYVAIQAEIIIASLHGQPASKPITLEKLLSEEEGIPYEVGEQLSKVANALNSMSQQEKRFLSEPSDEISQIKQSPSLGSAKNSSASQQSSPNSQPEKLNNSS
ncbi:MAG: hypothetical protein NWF00_04905 [Candidatus Bathyarchaeota archaeon]|nr:hypothetical protein [Candidatus Bathyarchaeota archaeon]